MAGVVERQEDAGDLRVGERGGDDRGFLNVEASEFEIGARALDFGLSGSFEERAGTSGFAIDTFGETEGSEQAGVTLAADVGSDEGEARFAGVATEAQGFADDAPRLGIRGVAQGEGRRIRQRLTFLRDKLHGLIIGEIDVATQLEGHGVEIDTETLFENLFGWRLLADAGEKF